MGKDATSTSFRGSVDSHASAYSNCHISRLGFALPDPSCYGPCRARRAAAKEKRRGGRGAAEETGAQLGAKAWYELVKGASVDDFERLQSIVSVREAVHVPGTIPLVCPYRLS